eukprot:CAMPEP_0119311792 /NCGR_PEP_ID=MMETSP1333-20130426/23868_1 /TAXON_ID=418940 /ORGANISM="Scyphosphaera apsteinii, Strain RCC1455" /LENGTH=245 /DNA_ID=CAMNT_0007316263 /DNA_START=9 /DNA_END=746 /DNA_ORIENTATION=+
MKIRKKSHARRHLNFYRAAYGIRAPYRVLIDGTGLQTAANLDVNLIDELPKVLGGRMQSLFVTRAVVAELRSLGKEFKAATSMAKRLPKLEGGTSQAAAAGDSVIGAVRDGNPQRLCVLTEDPTLYRMLLDLPGVPLLRFARQRLVLEPPSERSQKGAIHTSENHVSANSGRTQHEVAERQPDKSAEPLKRRRSKEPNPLSCLKKKKRKQALTMTASAAREDENQRRKRRRKRGSGSSKTAMADN